MLLYFLLLQRSLLMNGLFFIMLIGVMKFVPIEPRFNLDTGQMNESNIYFYDIPMFYLLRYVQWPKKVSSLGISVGNRSNYCK